MKRFRRGAAWALSLALVVALLPLRSQATIADDQESEWLGEICELYESGISRELHPDDFKYLRARLGVNNEGDPGGRSYGAYQFAANAGTPKRFFEWLQKHENADYRTIGDKLYTAYNTGSPGCGPVFTQAWADLADEYPELFWQAQHDYAIAAFYRPAVEDMEKILPGFKVENYSIALRNAIFSRTIQHGTAGFSDIVDIAINQKLGGFVNQTETELIDAIYAESGVVRPPKAGETNIMTGTEAKKYGIEGLVMTHFRGSSPAIQTHVYARLRINEPVLLQTLMQNLAYNDLTTYTVDQGIYQLLPMDGETATLALDNNLALTTLGTAASQRFKLTYYASGYYIITHVQSGLRLTDNRGNVTLEEPTANNNQFWAITPFEGGSGFSLKNRATGLYLTTTSLTAGGKAEATEKAAQWQLAVAASDWSLVSGSYPTMDSIMEEGRTSFSFKGMLLSTSPITDVTVSVKREDGTDEFPPVTAKPNASYYDLNAMDYSLPFSQMNAGRYKLIMEANNELGEPYRLESDFAIIIGPPAVIFNACGGSCSVKQMDLVAGSVYGTLPTASKAGYFFRGWFTAAEGGTQVRETDFAPNGKSTLYAHYEKGYTYSYVNYDGTVIASGLLEKGAVIPAPPTDAPTRSPDADKYYTFDGWDGYTVGMTIGEKDVVFTALYTAHDLETPKEMQSDTYAIIDGVLRRIPIGTTAETLTSHILPAGSVTVKKGGEAVNGPTPVSTGMTAEYIVGEETLQTLPIVVTGDINGDGEADGIDLNRIVAHMLGKTPLAEGALTAGDLNGDGEVDGIDLNKIVAYMLGKMDIVPN